LQLGELVEDHLLKRGLYVLGAGGDARLAGNSPGVDLDQYEIGRLGDCDVGAEDLPLTDPVGDVRGNDSLMGASFVGSGD
jgi:hypothetical protein